MVDLTFTPQIEILSAEDAPRRRHWSDADKIRVVEESHRGHRQVSATARRHGICRSLLTVWRRQYRDGELANASGPAFVPVKMALDIDAQSPRRPAPDVQLEILLRNGRRLLWTYVRDDRPFGGGAPPAALFHFSRDREMANPNRHLAGWQGILQTTRIDLRVAEVASPRPGERIEIDGDAFLIQGEPVRDRERLVWTVDLRPV